MTTLDLTPAEFLDGAEATAASQKPAGHGGGRRVLGLARANAVLLVRNRMTLAYAVLLPLFPLALMFTAPRNDITAGVTGITSVLVLAALFPIFYNLLSLTVTRRDELVLKRLRTGEATDREILASMALPGTAVFAVIAVITLGVAVIAGQPLPHNPVALGFGLVLIAATFVALALWTAAWTKNAEAAQITSMPVLLLVVLGQLRTLLPESWHRFVDLTPGAAMDALVRHAWFGLDYDGASLSLAGSFGAAAQPLVVLAVWAALATWYSLRTMRWEPRA